MIDEHAALKAERSGVSRDGPQPRARASGIVDSLCDGWLVRDVVSHINVECLAQATGRSSPRMVRVAWQHPPVHGPNRRRRLASRRSNRRATSRFLEQLSRSRRRIPPTTHAVRRRDRRLRTPPRHRPSTRQGGADRPGAACGGWPTACRRPTRADRRCGADGRRAPVDRHRHRLALRHRARGARPGRRDHARLGRGRSALDDQLEGPGPRHAAEPDAVELRRCSTGSPRRRPHRRPSAEAAGRVLADLGAEVIKVEPAGGLRRLATAGRCARVAPRFHWWCVGTREAVSVVRRPRRPERRRDARSTPRPPPISCSRAATSAERARRGGIEPTRPRRVATPALDPRERHAVRHRADRSPTPRRPT